MAWILNLETSTKNCSVSVSHEAETKALVEESSDKYIHSEKLHLFVQQAMGKAGISFPDLSAVAVGRGPGSYTGLRIGVAAAKGFCYALNIQLLSFTGLEILVKGMLNREALKSDELIIPMIDARRMEVYTSAFDASGQALSDVEARVLDGNSFSELKAGRIHMIGDAVEKARKVLRSDNFIFHDTEYPSASAMAELSYHSYLQQDYEDLAYFEPFYLKEFIAGKPKKLL